MAVSTVPLKGRDVDVEPLDEVQFMLLSREMRLARSEDDMTRKLGAIATCFDILESIIVKPEDRQYLMDLIKQRQLTLKDLMTVVMQLHEGEAEPTPAVRRGRATRTKA